MDPDYEPPAEDRARVALPTALILGLLLLFVAPAIFKFVFTPFRAHTLERMVLQSASNMKKVEKALIAHHEELGRYPRDTEGLRALRRGAEDPESPWFQRIDRKLLFDAWGQPIQYAAPGHDGIHPFDLFSFGADANKGGEGYDRDIYTWEWPTRGEIPGMKTAAGGSSETPAPEPE